MTKRGTKVSYGMTKIRNPKSTIRNRMIMFKKILLNICLLALTRPLSAQVTNAHVLFQYSMNPFQPTALPYNYLDKHVPKPANSKTVRNQRMDAKFKGWYFNVSSRSEAHPQIGTTTSSIVAVDHIDNPNKLGLKIGGGIAYQDLEAVQIVSPYLHTSMGMSLDDPYTGNWRLLGGAGIRFSSQQANRNLLFKDINDPKIPLVFETLQQNFTTIGISAALVDIRKMYIGIGLNRLLGAAYVSANQSSFTELNALFQYSLKPHYFKRTQRNMDGRARFASDPNRGLLTNINMSVATRYLLSSTNHPLHLQLNCRATLTSLFWGGIGWNTANRTQLQVGILKFPVLQEGTTKEYQCWVAYDLPTAATPKHGIELNLGFYF
jgi:hypothetical protein